MYSGFFCINKHLVEVEEQALRQQAIQAIQSLAAELVETVDGYFDEIFIASETIMSPV